MLHEKPHVEDDDSNDDGDDEGDVIMITKAQMTRQPWLNGCGRLGFRGTAKMGNLMHEICWGCMSSSRAYPCGGDEATRYTIRYTHEHKGQRS